MNGTIYDIFSKSHVLAMANIVFIYIASNFFNYSTKFQKKKFDATFIVPITNNHSRVYKNLFEKICKSQNNLFIKCYIKLTLRIVAALCTKQMGTSIVLSYVM